MLTEAMRKLEPIADTFDAVVFRGMSGALIAPIVAWELEKGLVAVRKPNELAASHSDNLVEGGDDGMRYLIVDDMIVSGCTVDEIRYVVENTYRGTLCVGIYLYNHPYQYAYRGIPVLAGALPDEEVVEEKWVTPETWNTSYEASFR